MRRADTGRVRGARTGAAEPCVTPSGGWHFERASRRSPPRAAARAAEAERRARGGSHAGGARARLSVCCDTLRGELEGAAHRYWLRAVYDRAEPCPPPEKEAKIFRCAYLPAWHQ